VLKLLIAYITVHYDIEPLDKRPGSTVALCEYAGTEEENCLMGESNQIEGEGARSTKLTIGESAKTIMRDLSFSFR